MTASPSVHGVSRVKMLAERDAPGDDERARELLSKAETAAAAELTAFIVVGDAPAWG